MTNAFQSPTSVACPGPLSMKYFVKAGRPMLPSTRAPSAILFACLRSDCRDGRARRDFEATGLLVVRADDLAGTIQFQTNAIDHTACPFLVVLHTTEFLPEGAEPLESP
jgi:hypothetical protein